MCPKHALPIFSLDRTSTQALWTLGLAARLPRTRSLVQTPLKRVEISAFQVRLGTRKITIYLFLKNSGGFNRGGGEKGKCPLGPSRTLGD